MLFYSTLRKDMSRALMHCTMCLVLLAATVACTSERSDSGEAPASSRAVPQSAVTCSPAPITGKGIGALTIGFPVDSVLLLCDVVQDTTVEIAPGVAFRVISVAFIADTVIAEIANDRVSRILVRSQGLYTSDHVSVGASITALHAYSDLVPIAGDGYLYAESSLQCGISFRLSQPPSSVPGGKWTVAELRSLPETVYVTRIIITGC